MRILFFIDTIQSGGAAKKTSLIASELARRTHEIYVITDTEKQSIYEFDCRVKFVPLCNSMFKSSRMLRLLGKMKMIRTIVRDLHPDLVITILPHVSFYVKVALIGLKVPIIFSDETSFARKDRLMISFIRRVFYNVADAVVILTENDKQILGKNIPKKVVINNPVVFPPYLGSLSDKKKEILAIGSSREWYIKGFDLLFKAFSPLVSKFPDWKLVIAGDASEPYYQEVLNMVKNEGIEDSVRFLGLRSDIFDVMDGASIYALSSRAEGFSLSLIEAMSQKCACVAFDNHGVINEVSCGGKGVVIVKDGEVNDFSSALDRLMSDCDFREELTIQSEECLNRYLLNNIVVQWEDLCYSLCGKKRNLKLVM